MNFSPKYKCKERVVAFCVCLTANESKLNLARLGKSESDIKVLLNKIKKDMVLLESHISFLENVEESRLKDNR